MVRACWKKIRTADYLDLFCHHQTWGIYGCLVWISKSLKHTVVLTEQAKPERVFLGYPNKTLLNFLLTKCDENL